MYDRPKSRRWFISRVRSGYGTRSVRHRATGRRGAGSRRIARGWPRALAEIDFQDAVDEDHTFETDCETYGCDQENDFCRCGMITDLRVVGLSPVYMAAVYARSLTDVTPSPTDLYAIERTFSRSRITPDDFDPVTEPGYYGEEIGSIALTRQAAARLEDRFQHVLTVFVEHERLRRTLAGEIEFAETHRWEARTVPVRDLRFDTAGMDRTLVSSYRHQLRYMNWADLPHGICVPADDGTWNVLDGRHRIAGRGADRDELLVLVPAE
jgi:hypothetical protein